MLLEPCSFFLLFNALDSSAAALVSLVSPILPSPEESFSPPSDKLLNFVLREKKFFSTSQLEAN